MSFSSALARMIAETPPLILLIEFAVLLYLISFVYFSGLRIWRPRVPPFLHGELVVEIPLSMALIRFLGIGVPFFVVLILVVIAPFSGKPSLEVWPLLIILGFLMIGPTRRLRRRKRAVFTSQGLTMMNYWEREVTHRWEEIAEIRTQSMGRAGSYLCFFTTGHMKTNWWFRGTDLMIRERDLWCSAEALEAAIRKIPGTGHERLS